MERKIYAAVPPKVGYSLTPLGLTLVDVLDSIREWAETNIGSVLEARASYDSRPAGEPEAV